MRLESITRYIQNKSPERIQNIINTVLENIPEVIYLTDEVYLDGGIYKSPHVEPEDYVELSFDFSLQDDKFVLEDANIANFSEAVSDKNYQMQLYTSEYLLQSVLAAAYHSGGLVFPPITFEDWEMVVFR